MIVWLAEVSPELYDPLHTLGIYTTERKARDVTMAYITQNSAHFSDPVIVVTSYEVDQLPPGLHHD